MTNEQIRARCEKFADETWTYGIVPDLESLYREAMAAGLEMAAHSAETVAFLLGNDRWKERNVLKDHAVGCREEAQRVKEGI